MRCERRASLYDRDDNGEYFQIYSRTFGEGFFFEIIERRGAYGGYGAMNAPSASPRNDALRRRLACRRNRSRQRNPNRLQPAGMPLRPVLIYSNIVIS